MKYSKRFIDATFHHFNHTLFNGELPLPEFKYLKNKLYQGYFIGCHNIDGPSYTIKINFKHYNKTYEEFCETLIHEMVHLFQLINGFKVNHGKGFKLIAKKIKRITGIDIR